jgi:hypothetical protein
VEINLLNTYLQTPCDFFTAGQNFNFCAIMSHQGRDWHTSIGAGLFLLKKENQRMEPKEPIKEDTTKTYPRSPN